MHRTREVVPWLEMTRRRGVQRGAEEREEEERRRWLREGGEGGGVYSGFFQQREQKEGRRDANARSGGKRGNTQEGARVVEWEWESEETLALELLHPLFKPNQPH